MIFDQRMPAHHRRVVRALEAGPRAPDRLHRRIEQMRAEAGRRSPPFARLRVRPMAAMAGAAAVLAIALVVALSLGGAGGPSTVQAAELGMLPSTQPPPPHDAQQPALLRRSFEGVTYPNWSSEFGWHPQGARSDELDGRGAETVFYEHQGHRIGYTVLSGEPLDPPSKAETVRVGGVELHRFRDGQRYIVTFERNGRTCILSGHVVDRTTLVELAAWKGEGSVNF